MDEIKENIPAFPTDSERQVGNTVWHYSGMTLRDYFAAKAMQGELACQNPEYQWVIIEGLAKRAYSIADAMIEARKS